MTESTNNAESVANALVLNPDGGNVGIGTTTVGTTLQVQGKISAAPSGVVPEGTGYPSSLTISQSLASAQAITLTKPGYYPWSIDWAYNTTDFAIMFLPTEGLFAEVIRRPGLVDFLQRQYLQR